MQEIKRDAAALIAFIIFGLLVPFVVAAIVVGMFIKQVIMGC